MKWRRLGMYNNWGHLKYVYLGVGEEPTKYIYDSDHEPFIFDREKGFYIRLPDKTIVYCDKKHIGYEEIVEECSEQGGSYKATSLLPTALVDYHGLKLKVYLLDV